MVLVYMWDYQNQGAAAGHRGEELIFESKKDPCLKGKTLHLVLFNFAGLN